MFARLNRSGYAPLWAPVMMLLVVALLAIAPDTAIAQETAPAEDPRAKDRGAGGATEHVVVAPGDSLWSISEEHLGAGATARQVALEAGRVYALNRDRIADPNTIFAGQTLLLPPGPQRGAPERRASRPSAAPEAAPAAPVPDKDGTSSGAQDNVGTAGAPDRANGPVALPEQAAMGAVPAVRPLSTEGQSSSSSSQPPMSRARAVVAAATTAAWALVEPFAPSGPQTPRRLIGLAMMLGSVGTGCVALALAAARVARRERRRERLSRMRREDWYRQAYAAPPHAGPSTARKERLSGRGPEEAASLSAAEPEGRQTPASGRSSSSWGTVRSQDKANGHAGAKPITKRKQKQSRLRRARLPGARRASAPRGAARSSRRAGKLAHRSTRIRRKIVAVHNKGPEAPGGWEISAPLRHSLEGLPLRADAVDGGALAALGPLVEAELGTVELIERRRPLMGKERRQASALRALLGSIRENEGAAAVRLAERR